MKKDSIFSSYDEPIKEAINDLKTKGKRHRQIPNILTLTRLTAPCFIIPAAALGNIPLVIGLTAFFSLTDLADGFIARTWKLSSELGAALDAATDKIFAATLLLAGSFNNPILLCNLGLEAAIAGINVYKKKNNLPAASTKVGKLKTWLLFPLMGLGIVSPYLNINNIFNILMGATTIMQVATVASYLLPILQAKQEIKQKEQVDSIITNNENIEETESQKEKVIDMNNPTQKMETEENESIIQLNAMRDFLISEKEFLEPQENKQTKENNYAKSKLDDFKK